MLPSGVGTQTKYMIEALLKSDKFEVISLGAAIKHPNYDTIAPEPYEGRWKIIPVDGYGDPNIIRSILAGFKPDILYFMTDPRFYGWLWDMEHEIRSSIPLVYYHVWDNKPYPVFNKIYYNSTDVIATISKVTSDIVQTVSPQTWEQYVPHAVDTEIFKPVESLAEEEKYKKMREGIPGLNDKMLFFWNNRNARRKQSGSLIFWFKDFLDRVGHDKAVLLMHTDIHDEHGQPLDYLISNLGLDKGQVVFSTQKYPAEELSYLYKISDCTINVADAEGFGLGTLESLACETPIIVTMTGGLQEQVTDGENWFGIGIEPASKAIIGSMHCPFIYEDRVSGEDVVNAMVEIFNMTPETRANLGKMGRTHVLRNYSFEAFNKTWVNLMTEVHKKCGSYETRKNYKSWELIQL